MENKIKEIFAPDIEERQHRSQTFKEISIYLIIALISIGVITIVPLLSGCLKGDIGFGFPTTVEGWILYWSINGGTTGGNIALFILFKQQALINSKKHPNYIKACEILHKYNGQREFIPRSPAQMNRTEYTKKLVTIVAFSTMSFITITSLVISFDFVTFISTFVSVIFALIMGWITMIKNEGYWTEEYLLYAEYIDKLEAEKPQGDKDDTIRRKRVEKSSRASSKKHAGHCSNQKR